MDFGRVADIESVDFSIPKDHKLTQELFKELKKEKKKTTKPEVYVGCAKWGRKDWIGKLYPPKTKDADFLQHYVKHYNCIELNAMFYRLFPKSTVERWASYADDGFRFCPKFPSVISHIRRLNNVQKETDEMLEAYSGFGNKLGPAFIQLDERFAPTYAERIHGYLKSLPRDFDVAIEFRHPDFSVDSPAVNEMYEVMKELGVSSVITDTAGRRDVMHMKLTTPTAFIRFVGNSLHKTDYERVDAWIDRIEKWLDNGLERIFFFMHMHDEKYSPELSLYLINKLNKQCGLEVKAPQLLNQEK